jgi:hypothetical protein
LDLNLLPDIVRQYASELSSTIGADPLGSAFAMIVAISGLVDGRSRLHIVDGFEQYQVINLSLNQALSILIL